MHAKFKKLLFDVQFVKFLIMMNPIKPNHTIAVHIDKTTRFTWDHLSQDQ